MILCFLHNGFHSVSVLPSVFHFWKKICFFICILFYFILYKKAAFWAVISYWLQPTIYFLKNKLHVPYVNDWTRIKIFGLENAHDLGGRTYTFNKISTCSHQFSLFSFGGFASAGGEPRALSMLSKRFATKQFLLPHPPPPPGHRIYHFKVDPEQRLNCRDGSSSQDRQAGCAHDGWSWLAKPYSLLLAFYHKVLTCQKWKIWGLCGPFNRLPKPNQTFLPSKINWNWI